MRRAYVLLIGVAVMVLAAGCPPMGRPRTTNGNANGANRNQNVNVNAALNANENVNVNGAPAATDFAAFVRELLSNTSDNTEPVEIDDREFTFTENESEFDDLLMDNP